VRWSGSQPRTVQGRRGDPDRVVQFPNVRRLEQPIENRLQEVPELALDPDRVQQEVDRLLGQ